MNQFNIIEIYTIFPQQYNPNSIQFPIDYKLGDNGTYPGTLNKVQKFHGIKEYSNQVLKELVLSKFITLTNQIIKSLYFPLREFLYLVII